MERMTLPPRYLGSYGVILLAIQLSTSQRFLIPHPMQVLDTRHGNPETASAEFDVEMSEVEADDADGGPFRQTLRQLGAVETAPDLRHFADVIDSSPIDVHAPSLSRSLGHRLSVPVEEGHKKARKRTITIAGEIFVSLRAFSRPS